MEESSAPHRGNEELLGFKSLNILYNSHNSEYTLTSRFKISEQYSLCTFLMIVCLLPLSSDAFFLSLRNQST